MFLPNTAVHFTKSTESKENDYGARARASHALQSLSLRVVKRKGVAVMSATINRARLKSYSDEEYISKRYARQHGLSSQQARIMTRIRRRRRTKDPPTRSTMDETKTMETKKA